MNPNVDRFLRQFTVVVVGLLLITASGCNAGPSSKNQASGARAQSNSQASQENPDLSRAVLCVKTMMQNPVAPFHFFL